MGKTDTKNLGRYLVREEYDTRCSMGKVRVSQEWLHQCTTRAVTGGPLRRDTTPALLLSCHHLEILDNLMFELVKSKGTLEHANEQRNYARASCLICMAAGGAKQLAQPAGEHAHTGGCPEPCAALGAAPPGPRALTG